MLKSPNNHYNEFRMADAIEFVRALDACQGNKEIAQEKLAALNARINELGGKEIPSYLLAAYRAYEAVIAPPMMIVKLDDTLPDQVPKLSEYFTIPAEIHSDDYVYTAEFDALPWFEQAEFCDINALAECEWGGDYAADAVAEWLEHHDPQIEEVLEYCRNQYERDRETGFEVHIDTEKALEWLKKNRRHFYDELAAKEE